MVTNWEKMLRKHRNHSYAVIAGYYSSPSGFLTLSNHFLNTSGFCSTEIGGSLYRICGDPKGIARDNGQRSFFIASFRKQMGLAL